MDKIKIGVITINANLKVTTFSWFRCDHSWPVKLATT